jgi:hypothetical protein
MNFITTHPFIALLLFVFAVAALTVVAAGMLKPEPPMEHIEPQDLMDAKLPCAWCLKEQGISTNPNDSHDVCPQGTNMQTLIFKDYEAFLQREDKKHQWRYPGIR